MSIFPNIYRNNVWQTYSGLGFFAYCDNTLQRRGFNFYQVIYMSICKKFNFSNAINNSVFSGVYAASYVLL
jgi:hypothetical protein